MVEAWYTYNTQLVYHSLHRKEAIFMSKIANGLGSLTYTMRNGKKYWTGRITLGQDIYGKQVRKSFSGYKKSDVVEKMKKASTFTNVSGIVDNGSQILGDFLKYWIFNIKAKEIKSTTVIRYDQLLRLHILPYPYADTKVKDITILNLQNFINYLVEEENTSALIAKNTLNLIKLFLDYCIVLGIIQTNPAHYVAVPKKEVHISSGKYRIFSQAEQEKIISALDLSFFVDQMIYLDFFTGLRRNELRGLQWRHFHDHSIIVDQQMRRNYTFDGDGGNTLEKNKLHSLKTECSFRTIPLPQIAVDFMNDLKKQSIAKHKRLNKPFTSSGFIFTDDLCQPIEEKRPNRRLQSICRRLNIEPRPLHSIRHSYATRLFEEGVDIKTVQELMGHSDYKTTLDIYTHVMPEKKKEAVSVFDKLYAKK